VVGGRAGEQKMFDVVVSFAASRAFVLVRSGMQAGKVSRRKRGMPDSELSDSDLFLSVETVRFEGFAFPGTAPVMR